MNLSPMLANKPGKHLNPTGWWLSEKLDGVRAIWTGSELVSRNGNTFHAPAWFTRNLPKDTVLDGELTLGRGRFQQTAGIVRSKRGDWSNIDYMIFDVINDYKFEVRQDNLKTLFGLQGKVRHWNNDSMPDWCLPVKQVLCESPAHLDQFEKTILAVGGEGVMLRKAGSLYEHKRSSCLYKLKRFQSEEATVIGHENGTGKYKGLVGALVCQFAGKVFKIGSGLTDQERKQPPVIGAQVTFTFFELTTAGIPRFPVFVTTRDYEGGAA